MSASEKSPPIDLCVHCHECGVAKQASDPSLNPAESNADVEAECGSSPAPGPELWACADEVIGRSMSGHWSKQQLHESDRAASTDSITVRHQLIEVFASRPHGHCLLGSNAFIETQAHPK